MDTDSTCPSDCPGCPATSAEHSAQDHAVADFPDDGAPLAGGRFALATLYVFGLPPATVIAGQVLLAGRIGELGALGVALAVSALLLAPAARALRPSKEAAS